MSLSTLVSPRLVKVRTRFDGMTIFFHWAIAGLVVILCIIGLIFTELDWRTQKYNDYYYWHRSLGEVAFVLALVSLWWRARREQPVAIEDAYWRASAARLVKGLITVLLVVVPSTKIARGAFSIGWEFFGLQLAAPFAAYRPVERILTSAHFFSAYALMIAVGIHTCGALWHHLGLKDDVLRRMLPRFKRHAAVTDPSEE